MDHTFITQGRNALRVLGGSSCGIGSTSGSISGYYNCVVDGNSLINFQRDIQEFRGHRSFFTNGFQWGLAITNGSALQQITQGSAAICIGNNNLSGLYLNDGSSASLYNDFSTHGNNGEGIVANNGSSVQYRATTNAYSESPLKMGFMCIDNDSRGLAGSYNSLNVHLWRTWRFIHLERLSEILVYGMFGPKPIRGISENCHSI